MKFKLKKGNNFNSINKISKLKYNFDLSDYYNKKTRIFTFPDGYVAWQMMAEVFRDFLEPLELVERIDK